MTLGGLALAVGRLIDDSVVVLENTVRHQEMRKSAPQAALEAAGEVAMPVLAATITTIIVFVPVVFLSGIAKFLFTPLAKSVAFSILASYVISMTIIPLFCASFLKSKTTKESASKSGHLPLEEGGKFERFAKRYEKLLVSLMKKKTLVMGSVVLLFFASLFLYPFIGKELFPRADVGYMTLYLRLPTGTRIEKTEDAMSKIEQSIKESVGQESIETMITNIGVLYDWPAAYTPNSGPGDAFIELELSHHRKYSMEEYSRRIRELFKKEYPQVELAINTGGIVTAALNMGLTSPINIQVAGNDLKVARGIAEEIMKRAEGVRGAVDTRIQERLDYPQIEIELNREAIAAKRMSVEEVVKNIVTALNSSVNFKPSFWIDPKNGNHYFLGAQYPEELIKSIETLQNLPLTGKDQKQVVLLKEIAHFKETTAPSEIRHRNIQRVVNVLVNTSGRDVGSVASEIKKRIRDISLPEGYKIYQRGEIESMNDSFKDLGGGLCLAIILVYLVLAAQFRSFRDPLLILITVPMGFIGVLAILWLSGSTLNIQSFIGVIFMVGISVSNGILLVEFANRLKKEGLLPSEAAVKAARIRLRPILMTTLAAFLGLLPMAIGFGHGSEANVPLGRAVVGGLLVSTILTLLVLPLLYAGVENWKIFPLRNKKAAVLGLFILFCVSCGNAWAQETPTAESVRILTLKETIDTVFRQNPEILMAKARHTQGQADVTIESSAYWPRVNLSGMDSWGLGGSSSAIGITGLINSPNRKGLAGGIDASWVVFDFGRTTSKVNAAVKKEKAREAEIVERMANLKLMAIQSYGEGLFYSDLVKLLKERESRQENLTAEIEKYVRSGLNSPVELNLAKASLENTHAAQAQAVGRLVQSWEMLKELMGVSSNEFFSFEIPEGILPDPGPSETLLANAAKNRPEMKLAERNYEAASAERWAAQLERAPKLVAVSSAGFLEDTNPPGADEWSAGIGVTMPVFDGFQMEGKLNKAKAIEDEARALLDEWKNRIRREVASAYAQWEAAKKSQQTMEEQLRLTQSAYDLAHKR
ncbi:MAG: hypothetical protein COT00_02785, partial [Candidatus Omnitrophica bacterium CG07_land_8_20_14_0_80_50_8]